VSFRNFPFPRWTIVLVHVLHLVGFDVEVHALHLVGFDVKVFLPLERLPATANESVLPGHSTYDVSVIYLLILTKQYHMNGIFEILIDICILYQ